MREPVLIVCGAGYVSGKEIMAFELGQGLAELGQPVTYVTSIWNNGDFSKRLQEAGLPNFQLPTGFISATLTKKCIRMTAEQIWRWPGLVRIYSQLLRRLKPRLAIHTNWHHLLLLFPLLRPQRDVFWVHEVFPDRPQYRRLFRLLDSRIGIFVCVSFAVAGSLRRLGVSDERIIVIHNGLTDLAGHGSLRVSPTQRFRIGIVGQVGLWKGHDDLIEALPLILSRHSMVEVHIYGKAEPAYRKNLLQKCSELGVSDFVHWYGFVHDRKEVYEGLDVCVVPSRSADPLPTTAIEAGFFGLPTVVTAQGGLPEIIEDDVNGLLVKAGQPAEIADALCRLIEDPALWLRLATGARERAITRFNRGRFVREFLALLEEPDRHRAAHRGPSKASAAAN